MTAASLQLHFKLEGQEKLKELASATRGLRKVAEVSWHSAATYVLHHITSQMYAAKLGNTGHSLPGGYPAVQTGQLIASLHYVVHNWQGFEIYSNATYASFVEQGTAKMAARPYLQPGMTHNLQRIKRFLEDNLKKALKL